MTTTQTDEIKTWQQRLEETCPALGPMHIHACVEEVNDAMQAEINDLRVALQEQAPTFPAVLDACCGSRMFWFDKQDDRALFVDKRRETWPIDIGTPGTIGRSPIVVDPDEIADFTALPYPDAVFSLVVFDPPHIERTEAKGLLTKKYGHLTGNWREELRQGFAECFRVLKPQGTLIFKWAESDHPVSEVLALTPEKPLFGHRSGKQSATHWIAFMKAPT